MLFPVDVNILTRIIPVMYITVSPYPVLYFQPLDTGCILIFQKDVPMRKNNPEYICKKCGDELFADDEIDYKKMIGIKVHSGVCDICKNKDSLTPIRDYEYACGRRIIWD